MAAGASANKWGSCRCFKYKPSAMVFVAPGLSCHVCLDRRNLQTSLAKWNQCIESLSKPYQGVTAVSRPMRRRRRVLSYPLLNVHVAQSYTVGASRLLHREPAGSCWLRALHKAVPGAVGLRWTAMLPALQGRRKQQT